MTLIARAMVSALALCAIWGCSGAADIPQTFPVTGKVSDKDGHPFPGGVMQWHLLADPTLTVNALIKDDGTFEVFTLYNNRKLTGTVPGEFEVTIHPRVTGSRAEAAYRPARRFLVTAGKNEFDIEAEVAR